jgi:hypothetical protein
MNTTKMLQPHYAEAWTLVELLARQPGKFGKLLLALRKGDSELAAIDKVYGLNEKRLTREWHAYVMTRVLDHRVHTTDEKRQVAPRKTGSE